MQVKGQHSGGRHGLILPHTFLIPYYKLTLFSHAKEKKKKRNTEGAWKYDLFLNSLTTAPVINWLFQELGSLEVLFFCKSDAVRIPYLFDVRRHRTTSW